MKAPDRCMQRLGIGPPNSRTNSSWKSCRIVCQAGRGGAAFRVVDRKDRSTFTGACHDSPHGLRFLRAFRSPRKRTLCVALNLGRWDLSTRSGSLSLFFAFRNREGIVAWPRTGWRLQSISLHQRHAQPASALLAYRHEQSLRTGRVSNAAHRAFGRNSKVGDASNHAAPSRIGRPGSPPTERRDVILRQ